MAFGIEEVAQVSVEESLRLLDSVLEAFNAHDPDRLDKVNAESMIFYATGLAEPLKGRAAVREWNKTFMTAFPDVRIRKERSFGQGDWICVEGTIVGTHKGPLPGPGGRMIPATNRPIRLDVAATLKVEGGEGTEVHMYLDQLALMTQLGLTP